MEQVSATKRTKVHSLIDKVYSRTNLKLAWDKAIRAAWVGQSNSSDTGYWLEVVAIANG